MNICPNLPRADQYMFISEAFMAQLTLLSMWDGAWAGICVGRRDVLLLWRGYDSAGWGQGGEALE